MRGTPFGLPAPVMVVVPASLSVPPANVTLPLFM
jgi:hypothetical protein